MSLQGAFQAVYKEKYSIECLKDVLDSFEEQELLDIISKNIEYLMDYNGRNNIAIYHLSNELTMKVIKNWSADKLIEILDYIDEILHNYNSSSDIALVFTDLADKAREELKRKAKMIDELKKIILCDK